jgi:hypothetical protein
MGGSAAHAIVESPLLTADAVAPRLGPGEAPVNRGERPACGTPRGQPGGGLKALPRGATAVTAGVVDVGGLPPGLAWPQLPTHGRGACAPRSQDARPERRQPAAPSGMTGRRPAESAASRAVVGAGPTATAGVVRGVEGAVVLGRVGPRRAWRTRHATPRSHRWGAEACRRGWRRLWRGRSGARPR